MCPRPRVVYNGFVLELIFDIAIAVPVTASHAEQHLVSDDRTREASGGRHSLCGQPCPLLADYCPDCRVNGDKPPADEPSPLTGEEGKAERVDYVTRAELIAALREVGADADVPTSNALFELRKLLESRAAKGGSDGW